MTQRPRPVLFSGRRPGTSGCRDALDWLASGRSRRLRRVPGCECAYPGDRRASQATIPTAGTPPMPRRWPNRRPVAARVGRGQGEDISTAPVRWPSAGTQGGTAWIPPQVEASLLAQDTPPGGAKHREPDGDRKKAVSVALGTPDSVTSSRRSAPPPGDRSREWSKDVPGAPGGASSPEASRLPPGRRSLTIVSVMLTAYRRA